MTKYQLMSLLFWAGSTPDFYWQGRCYTLKSIEREDGSGISFNVHVVDMYNRPCTLYIKTID